MRSSAGYEKNQGVILSKCYLQTFWYVWYLVFGWGSLKLKVRWIGSCCGRFRLKATAMPTIFFVAIFIVCTFLHTQKEIHWTSISVFVFVFALKSIFSSKNISLHYWTLTSIVRNKVTVFGHFLVYQKQLWLHKHWSIGTVRIYFSTFVRFLRLTIILLLILKEEKKKMECNTKTEKFAYWIKRK